MKNYLLLLMLIIAGDLLAQPAYQQTSRAPFPSAAQNKTTGDKIMQLIGATVLPRPGSLDTTRSVVYSYPIGAFGFNTALNDWAFAASAEHFDDGQYGFTPSNNVQRYYNNDGSIRLSIRQRWNHATATWVVEDSIGYRYANNKIEEIETRSRGQRPEIMKYEYDGRGRRTLERKKYWDYTNQRMDSSDKVTTYGTDSITSIRYYARDVSGNWVTVPFYDTFIYNNSKLVEIAKYGYMPYDEIRELYSYSPGGDYVTLTSVYRIMPQSPYDTAWTQFHYNTLGLCDTIYTITRNSAGAFDKRYNYLYEYNAQGLQTVAQFIRYVGNNPVYDEVSLYHYKEFDLNVTGLDDEAANLSLYPVPASDWLNIDISSEKAGVYQMAICHIDGRLVCTWTKQLPAGNSREQIDMTDLPAGNYLLYISAAGKKMSRQFSVVR